MGGIGILWRGPCCLGMGWVEVGIKCVGNLGLHDNLGNFWSYSGGRVGLTWGWIVVWSDGMLFVRSALISFQFSVCFSLFALRKTCSWHLLNYPFSIQLQMVIVTRKIPFRWLEHGWSRIQNRKSTLSTCIPPSSIAQYPRPSLQTSFSGLKSSPCREELQPSRHARRRMQYRPRVNNTRQAKNSKSRQF